MSATLIDNPQRFSDRAEYYANCRPHDSRWANVLTGKQRLSVVEPHEKMRRAAERPLSDYPNFRSVTGAAEATSLADRVADFLAAGSAFHWFDRPRCLQESKRILKPHGQLVVPANHARSHASPRMQGYGELIRRYGERGGSNLPSTLRAIFGEHGLSYVAVDDSEQLDRAQARRVLSDSSMPPAGHSQQELTVADSERIFHQYPAGGLVPFAAETIVYWGTL